MTPQDLIPGLIAGGSTATPPVDAPIVANPTDVATPKQDVAAPPTSGVAVSPAPEGSPATAVEPVVSPDEANSLDASIADSAAAADPELAQKPGFQNLRASYLQRVQQVKDLSSRVAELEAGQTDALLNINAPAEDWAVKEQLDGIRQNFAPYYNRIAWEMMERHLPEVLPVFLANATQLPAEMRPLVEASATAILQSYTGLEPEEIGAAIRMYRQSQGGALSPPTIGQTGYAPNQGTDVSQLAFQYGLDSNDPKHFALLTQISAQQRELSEMKSSVQTLTQGEQKRLEQTGEGKLTEQLGTFKNNLFARIDLPQGYEEDKADLERSVNQAFESDPTVVQARSNLLKFYRQGTPDLKAAAGELTKIQTRLSYHYKSITEPRIARIRELERFKTAQTQQQQQSPQIPSNVGSAPPPSATPSLTGRVSPEQAAERAVERWRAAQVAKPKF